MRWLCVCPLVLLVAGCAVGDGGKRPRALEDATVVVERTLKVPANTLYVWFQGGSPQRRLTEFWAPYCKLRLADDSNEPRTISPGRFAVEWVRHEYRMGRIGHPPLALRRGRHMAAGMLASPDTPDADPMYVAPEIVLALSSGEQPSVQRLTCGVRRGTITLRDPPTLADIETALGDYLRIEPRADAALGAHARFLRTRRPATAAMALATSRARGAGVAEGRRPVRNQED